MCIESTRVELDTTPINRAYKVFTIYNGKVYSQCAGKEIDIEKAIKSGEYINSKLTEKEKTKLQTKNCIVSYDSNYVIYSNDHIGFISSYLDFQSVMRYIEDKNKLVALVHIPYGCKVKIGIMANNGYSIILSEKIRIMSCLQLSRYGNDWLSLSSEEIKERIKNSILPKKKRLSKKKKRKK